MEDIIDLHLLVSSLFHKLSLRVIGQPIHSFGELLLAPPFEAELIVLVHLLHYVVCKGLAHSTLSAVPPRLEHQTLLVSLLLLWLPSKVGVLLLLLLPLLTLHFFEASLVADDLGVFIIGDILDDDALDDHEVPDE